MSHLEQQKAKLAKLRANANRLRRELTEELWHIRQLERSITSLERMEARKKSV